MAKNVLNTDLTGKVAVVTGAGGVLCSAFSKALARAGAKVALLGRTLSSLQAVGAFLPLGLLVAPAATMYLLTDRATWLFWGGGLIGGLGAIAAFFLSYPLGWHLGATIIVVLGSLFLLAYIFSPRYGLLRRGGK
jgi:hypothetical protein